jgi:capsular polysaccharide biosynthesis protein
MTQQQSNQQQYPQNYPPYEDEINLIDYLKVLWKWKWLIIAGTLICAVAAAVISLQMPKIYEISTVIEPGIASIKDEGGFMYIDSVANISGKINGGIYDRRIKEALRLDPLKTGVKFKSAIVKKANLIKVTSQWEEKDTGLGIKVTGQLIHFLVGDYEKVIEQKEGSYSNQIIMKQNEINNMKTRKKLQQANLKNIGQTKEELLRAIKEVKENVEKVIHQRDLLLKSKRTGNSTTLLLYSTTVQQNVTYFNQLSNELYGLNAKEEEIKAKIEAFPEDMADIKARINTLNLEKALIDNIKVIQEPEVSLHPVKPKKKQIVLLATVVALFMAVFLAFFIEYIKNASKASSANKRT